MPATCATIDGIVESTYTGDVPPDEQRRNIARAVELARAQGRFRFLTDLSAMHRGPTPGDLLAAIDHFDVLGLPRTLREALVLPPGSVTVEDVRFYEDACQNRGWNMRIFPGREAAIAWLLGP